MSRCDSCTGNCCTRGGSPIIDVLDTDVIRLATHLKLSPEEFTSTYLAPPQKSKPRWVGNIKLKRNLLVKGGSCCPFLLVDVDGNGRCGVYEARPDICRDWDAETCSLYTPKQRSNNQE